VRDVRSNRFKHDLPFKPRWGNDPGKLRASPDLLISYYLNPRYAIKEYSSCGALYTKDCSCSEGSVEDKILVPKPPENYARCAKCGHPVNGPYCQGCTLLREKLEEDLLTYFQKFQNTSESSDGSTNIVNAPRGPFVAKQDHGVNPPHIDECCYECGEALDGIICQRSSNIFNPPPQPPIYSCEICGSNAQYGHYCTPQAPFINLKPEDIHELRRKLLEDLQIISEVLEEYINSLSWNCPTFYNDDDDDDEYKSDEVIKSSVENLVPIPSEFDGISDDTCDVPFCDNSPPLDVLNDHFELFSEFNDDCTSSDVGSFKDIDYVEASPLDYELVSLEEVKDDIVCKKLLNINLLIAKIESLNDNPTLDWVLKYPSLFPIPVKDSDSFFEKSDTSISYSDNSLTELETFSDHTEETSSGSTTTHANNSLPEYDSFLFEFEPDQGELTSIVMKDILGEPHVHVPNVLPTHPTLLLDSDFIPSDDSLGFDHEVSFPFGTRNKILDPGIFFEVQSKISITG
nr:hypothetical protein [Tanacetum cinerariifolium]